MLSSSFFAIISLLPLLSTAATSSFPHRSLNNTKIKRSSYKLTDKFSGNSFFNGWNYDTFDDPTHGQVNYLSQSAAVKAGLSYVQNDSTVVIAVDDYTHLSNGQKRNSVRLSSKKTFNGGLFIMDLFAMPHGCSVWPAWWTVGPNWPNGGEIDIIEGVNSNTKNQMTLHTGAGCSAASSARSTSQLLGSNCVSSNGNNDGCGYLDWSDNSYGHGLNMMAGGVFAMLWDGAGIRIWHFPRGSIPSDLQKSSPNPSSWPTPAAFWPVSACSADHFKDHQMVIDTTLCGDWAGAAFSSAGCGSSCSAFVADPNNFKLAKWKINYVAVYQAS